METARKKAIADVKFYEENDDCPVCKQGLDHDHKEKCIKEREDKAEIKRRLNDIDKTIGECRDEIQRINVIQSEIDEIQRERLVYYKLRLYLIKSILRNYKVR